MPQVFKFKIDQNLPVELAAMLTAAGHDSATVEQQGMAGADDDRIAQVCSAEGRGLVTLDLDFADIRRYPPEDHAGLLVLRLTIQDKANVLRVFGRVIGLLETEPVVGRLWVIDESTVRIRGGD